MTARLSSTHRDAAFVRRLRWQTGVTGVLVFLIPFSLFYLLVGTASDRHVRSQTYERLQAGVSANTGLLDDVFTVRMAEVESLARTFEQSPAGSAVWSSMLQAFVETSPWYESIVVLDDEFNLIASSGGRQKSVHRAPCLERTPPDKTIVCNWLLPPPAGWQQIAVATPVATQRMKKPAILHATLRLEKLNSRLLDLGVGATGQMLLVTYSGRIVAPLPAGGRPGLVVFEGKEPNPLQNDAGTTRYHDHRGHQVLAAYRKLRHVGLYLVAQVDESEVLASASALQRSILLYLAPFLALGVGLAVVAWHFGINYIGRLTGEVYDALEVARQHERERDLAHQELARRFEEERELSRQKVQFQAQLANYEKNVALAQLALGAAHEINNPLLGLLTYLELKARAARDEDEQAEIQQCIQAAKRISAAIRGLLNYARPDPLQLAKVDLKPLIEETLSFLHRQPLLRGKKLIQEIPSGLPAITADPNQMTQILTNLLLNAADATPDGGQITVSARPLLAADRVEIVISDTGHGIPPDVLPHVFDPFFTTKRTRGTGLGLSITQTYVHSHQGDIQIESAPGKGTTVRITLPIEQKQEPVAETLRAAS